MLYIRPKNSGTGHYVLKLKKKEKILVPKVILVPMLESMIKVVSEWEQKKAK